ncbi:MAG: DUF488 domain-containing protein [bacterium]|nr:DUF488 domain-containing protein [bacterium]
MNAQPSLFPNDVPPCEPGEKRIFTIGHSTRPLEELLAILAHYRIESLVDVRHFPTSRHNPQFNKDSLHPALSQHGIEYHWLQFLGGYRSRGYLAHMETEDFRRGIARLEELAAQKLTAYMCAEVKWYRCHRRHVSDVLEQRGWRVIHIIDQTRAEPHTEKHNVIKCD